MGKHLLKEDINYKVEKVILPNSTTPSDVLYIDPYTSEQIYMYKDILFKYGAKYVVIGRERRWQWVLPDDNTERQEYLNTYVYPCIRELNQLENKGNPRQNNDEMVNSIHLLISDIDKVINARIESNNEDGVQRAEQVKEKLSQFKQQLLKATTDEEFRAKFEPILKKVTSGGRRYSLMNSILIMIQDPEATYVYPTSKWRARNRYVDTAHAKPIFLYVPIIRPDDKANRDAIIKAFLKEVGERRNNGKPVRQNQLTPNEETELYKLLAFKTRAAGWTMSDSFYDIRFTKVIRGKKDLTVGVSDKEKLVNTKDGNENGDLKWFDADSPETTETERIYDALIKVIQDMGIKINYKANLGGARGVSTGGVIEVLQNAPKNIGTINTLVHELAHELFHQDYFNKNNSKWGKYFLGRNERHLMEQQAELCAWIVMRFLGYDMKTNINYLGNWGVNEENAVEVFDAVAVAADKITRLLLNELNDSTEAEFDDDND